MILLRGIYLLFFYVLVFLSLSSPAIADCKIRVRVSDFKPQYYQDDKGKWRGLAVEYAEALLKEANCLPVFHKAPWKRALRYMRSGQLDLMLNLSITDERKQYMHFIGPQRDETMVFVVRKDADFMVSSLDDLKKLPGRIGIEAGNYFGKTFDDKIITDRAFRDKFAEVHDTALNIQKLEHERIVGFFSEKYNAVYKMSTDPTYKNFKINPFIVNQDQVYFGVSRRAVTPELLVTLKNAYERAKSKGIFDKILDRYR